MSKTTLFTTVSVTLAAATLVAVLMGDETSAQTISLTPGSVTPPPPPPAGPPCFGANFSADGDVWDPIGLATIPMGPGGCGLGWPGPALPSNVDGFSSGVVAPPGLPFPVPPGAVSILFSVDLPATGTTVPGCAPGVVPFPPNVGTESALLPLSSDAPADVYYTGGNFAGPLPFAFPPMPHSQIADGNGPSGPPFFNPPLGLVEPMPGGDDLDSLDVVPVVAIDSGPIDGVPDIQVYYSVDIPTAGTIGASGADVLGSFGGFTFLYAPAALLGLDGGGPNTDDIDALVVSDPPMGGYAPIAGGGGDYVLFSLAPGSGSLGLPDTCMGIPIEEGDVLADAFLFTGIGGLVPCILIPEEIINLWPARTCGLHPFHPGGDNIDGLDFVPAFPTPTSTTTSTSTTTTITTSTTTTSTSTTTSTTLAPLCGPAPEPDGSCKLADVSGLGKSSLQIKNDADNTKDSFKWKWNKGVATLIGDFDTPTVAGSTYRLCVYDASINPQPLLEADIPNGGLVPTCGTQPCWKPSGSTGFKYKNKAGTPEGVTGAKFKAGAAGKAQVQVRGKGGLLGPPATGSLAPSVVVQLLIDDGVTTECFKTTFSTFTLQSATQYKAKGP